MKYAVVFLQAIVLLAVIASCKKDEIGKNSALPGDTITYTKSDSLIYNADWTYVSHGKSSADYGTVFPQDAVNKIEIIIGQPKWKVIRANMLSLFGFDFGGNPGGGDFPETNPDYVDVTLKFNGKIWKNVGFRLKGNSSLSQAWGQGIYKLPFKLDFDKFEDEYPAVSGQRFYGFDDLSMSPGFNDQSLMREKLTADIFRMGGIPVAQTAFYRVFIDFGSGLKYCGVYTVVELPEDTMLKAQFGEKKGNLYKPESKLSTFILSEFEKQNNEDAADYTDVESFINILNSDSRISNAGKWRSGLEATFDVTYFLKYLAINNTIVNWDSYGNMAHNYYLYHHSVNKLTWIPWDHNEALSGSPGIVGSTGTAGGARRPLSLSMNEVTADWPLIKYLADDAVYRLTYKENLKIFTDEVFTESNMDAMLDKYYNLILPYAIGPDGEQRGYTFLESRSAFTNSLALLKAHMASRRELVAIFVQ